MMMEQQIIKPLSVLLCVIIIGAMTLLALGRMEPMAFWVTAALCAICAFVVLPWLARQ